MSFDRLSKAGEHERKNGKQDKEKINVFNCRGLSEDELAHGKERSSYVNQVILLH